jgi:N-acetylmuramoyl-L-alanine amidase
MNFIHSPSTNYTAGRSGYAPEAIVVHCTDGFFPSDLGWLRNPESQVSAHYVVGPNGEVHQLVLDGNTAWHAGKVLDPTWTGIKRAGLLQTFVNPNFYTIGIEVSLRPPALMPEAQNASLQALIKLLATTHGIKLDRQHIIGHKEIRGDKTCPGTINMDRLVGELAAPVVDPAMVNKEEMKRNIINYIKSL